MRNEHGEKLQPRDELVITAKRRVVVAPVEDAAVIAVLQTLEGDGRTLHVLKKTFELQSLALGDAAIARDVESRMLP